MRIKILSLLSILFLLNCLDKKSETQETEKEKDQNKQFDAYKQRFILSLWKLYPGWASGVGYHNYDSILVVPDEAQRETELAFNKAQIDSLKEFNVRDLSDYNKIDHHLIEDYLEASDWGIKKLRSFHWDPSNYNVCGSFSEMLNNNYDSLDTRLVNFYAKLKNVPLYYSAAKNNIKHPTVEHTQLAVMQNEGGVSVFTTDLEDFLKKSKLDDQFKQNLKIRAAKADSAVKDFVSWLKVLKVDSPRSFRLGEDLYKEKFDHDIQSRYRAEVIFEKAIEHKKTLHQKMYAITKTLWPKYMKKQNMPADSLLAIRQMIDVLSVKHVKPNEFQSAIEKQIPVLVDFINKKDLIYLDPTKPLVVRKEPAYMAGLAGASISSPGPYDINGNTYYNVGSLSGWPKEKSESYLREYNHYILQILNIHEAIPGHYTQLIYSNKSAAQGQDSGSTALPGIIKSILGNGAMVEGWAVYTELMMLENGYGAPEGSSEPEPEMWLMYYKWNLRSTCNTILDYSVHVKNMVKDQAVNFLTREAFQQQAEAEGKWRRVTLSQVQLCSYYTGFTEICALREEYKKKMGDKYNLKQFHEKFLSYGSAPVKYISELMLDKD